MLHNIWYGVRKGDHFASSFCVDRGLIDNQHGEDWYEAIAYLRWSPLLILWRGIDDQHGKDHLYEVITYFWS